MDENAKVVSDTTSSDTTYEIDLTGVELLDNRQRKYLMALLEGKEPGEASLVAGYSGKGGPDTAPGRLIRDIVDSVRSQAMKRAGITADRILRELDEGGIQARDAKYADYKAFVRSRELLGRAVGVFDQTLKVEHQLEGLFEVYGRIVGQILEENLDAAKCEAVKCQIAGRFGEYCTRRVGSGSEGLGAGALDEVSEVLGLPDGVRVDGGPGNGGGPPLSRAAGVPQVPGGGTPETSGFLRGEVEEDVPDVDDVRGVSA